MKKITFILVLLFGVFTAKADNFRVIVYDYQNNINSGYFLMSPTDQQLVDGAEYFMVSFGPGYISVDPSEVEPMKGGVSATCYRAGDDYVFDISIPGSSYNGGYLLSGFGNSNEWLPAGVRTVEIINGEMFY